MGNGTLSCIVNAQTMQNWLTPRDGRIQDVALLDPLLFDQYLSTCNRSWRAIIASSELDRSNENRSGTDMFLDAFYCHLTSRDETNKITRLLDKGSQMRGFSLVFVMVRYILLMRKKPYKSVSLSC
jgi:hypothetical protein